MKIEQMPQYEAWCSGVEDEIKFWTSWFASSGLSWRSEYDFRLNPQSMLQPRPASLLPNKASVSILDVGAGPLTFLGKKHPRQELLIEAVDPLADFYDRILNEFHIEPIVRTKKGAAEELSSGFQSDAFDLVFARNCLDHGIDPESAISEMLRVVKSNCFVLLEHRPREAEVENYVGMHQWNFDLDENGDFWVWSKFKNVNISKMLAGIAQVECERLIDDGPWIITRIRKI